MGIRVETGRSTTRSRTSPNRTYSATHSLVVEAEIGRVQLWMLTHTYSGHYRTFCHSGNQDRVYLTAETGPTPKAAANLGRHEPAYYQICPSEPKPARRYESLQRGPIEPTYMGRSLPSLSTIDLRHDQIYTWKIHHRV